MAPLPAITDEQSARAHDDAKALESQIITDQYEACQAQVALAAEYVAQVPEHCDR